MINLSDALASRRRHIDYCAGLGLAALGAVLAASAAEPLSAAAQPHGPEGEAPAQAQTEAQIAGVSAATPATGESPDPVARHQAALQQVRSRLQALRAGIADQVLYRKALRAELRQSEQDIDDLARANRQLTAMAASQQQALEETAERLQQTRERLAQQRAALAELLRAAHVRGHGGYLRLLLDDEALRRKTRAFGYYRVLADARAARVARIDLLRQELAALEREGRDEAARLQRLAARQEQTRLRLSDARRARAAVLADLEQALAEDRGRVAALAADAEALHALIERLKREAEIRDEIELDQTEISERRGQLTWPIAPAQLVRPFGKDRGPGALHADGVLLAATPGAEVRAVHHGRVAYADWLRGFGMLIVIDHGGGYMTLYGHNQTLLKEVGEWVASGDLIALSGNSGGAERDALYFAIRHQGQALDPSDWCRARAG
ncbi:MAG: peptidoglycan DD-metalloendopeptidase family protein [Gammaproteobacteria bacterium]|jgi:septal ring factor EnvC (AmiA/AmiB activator)|nr:peptidoglycan DD-metalloendopeptidase family protein [Gammaproteobacteria bacterium]